MLGENTNDQQPHLLRRMAEKRGCLFLFGDAAVKENTGILLIGPPGIGKTTVMGMLPEPWYELCQDLIAITPDEQKQPRISSLSSLLAEKKFYSFDEQRDFTHSPRLQAVFFLSRAPNEFISPLNIKVSIGLLLEAAKGIVPDSTCDLPLNEAQAHRLKRFESILWLAQSVSCYELGLGKVGACQRLIEDALT